MRQIWSLQYLRAFAAVGVVVYHALAPWNLFPLGAAGVDIFFVLSGFLMFTLTARRPIGPARFLLDRAARIAPLYWLATLATFAASTASRAGIPLVSRSPVLLLQSLLFLPRGPSPAPVYPTLFVGWTLDYEVFFYLVFAGMLTLGARRRLPAMTACFGALVLLGALIHPRDCTLSTYANPIILEFLAGAWIAACFERSAPGQTLGRAVGLALVFAAPVVLHDLPRSGFALLAITLVGSMVAVERAALIPKLPALRFVGDASYSIYLFHVLAFTLADFVLTHGGRLVHAVGGTPFLVACRIASGIGLGCLVHLGVERPLLRGTRRLLSRTARMPVRIAEVS